MFKCVTHVSVNESSLVLILQKGHGLVCAGTFSCLRFSRFSSPTLLVQKTDIVLFYKYWQGRPSSVPPEDLFVCRERSITLLSRRHMHRPPIVKQASTKKRHFRTLTFFVFLWASKRRTNITMKFQFSLTMWAILAGSATAFVSPQAPAVSSTTALNMVLEKPKEKKLPKIEVLKIDSDHLIHPLKEVGYFVVGSFSFFWMGDHIQCELLGERGYRP